jgi:hypothetical protein
MRLSRRRLLGFLLSFPLLSLLKPGPAYAAKVVDPDHLITKRGSTIVLPSNTSNPNASPCLC